MIRYILGILFICFCGLLGYAITVSPDTIEIVLQNKIIKVDFFVAIIFAFIASYIVAKLLKLIYVIWNSPDLLTKDSKLRKKRKADKLLRKGLEEMIAGHYNLAEKHWIKGAEISKSVGEATNTFYEMAAMVADRQNATDRRNEYLLAARKEVGKTGKTLLNEAELALNNQQYAQAESYLEKLLADEPRNNKINALLDSAYVGQNKWRQAHQHLSKMREQLSASEFQIKSQNYAVQLFKSLSDENAEFSELEQYWKGLSNELRQDNAVILQYAESAINLNHADEAEKVLLNQIKNNHDLGLIQAYSQLTRANYAQQLENILNWEKHHAQNPIFLFAKANTAFKAQNYQLALETIERVVQNAPSREAFILWAQILEALGQSDAALAAYRQGLAPQQALQGTLLPPQ